jgi:hypothetical protein
MKRTVLFSAIFLAAAVSLVMTEGRLYAMEVYGAPCGQASGFLGLLQKSHFLPTSGCVASGTTCTNAGSDCTASSPVSGGAIKGKCTQVTNGCLCVQVTH